MNAEQIKFQSLEQVVTGGQIMTNGDVITVDEISETSCSGFDPAIKVFVSENFSSNSSVFSDPPSSCDEMPGRGSDFQKVCRINMVSGSEVANFSGSLVPFSPDPPPYTSDSETESDNVHLLHSTGFLGPEVQSVDFFPSFRMHAPPPIQIANFGVSSPILQIEMAHSTGGPARDAELAQPGPSAAEAPSTDPESGAVGLEGAFCKSAPPFFQQSAEGGDLTMHGTSPISSENPDQGQENYDNFWAEMQFAVQKNERDISELQANVSAIFSTFQNDISKATSLVQSCQLQWTNVFLT